MDVRLKMRGLFNIFRSCFTAETVEDVQSNYAANPSAITGQAAAENSARPVIEGAGSLEISASSASNVNTIAANPKGIEGVDYGHFSPPAKGNCYFTAYTVDYDEHTAGDSVFSLGKGQNSELSLPEINAVELVAKRFPSPESSASTAPVSPKASIIFGKVQLAVNSPVTDPGYDF
jgi:hypothetical protein